MQTLNLLEFSNMNELSIDEMSQIDGGNFWYDLAYAAGVIVQGFVVFGSEGGKSAGICVH